MTESAKVVKVKGKKATIRIDKKDECAKCGLCLFGKNVNYIEYEVNNTVGAKEGDVVKIERHPAVLTGAIMAFLIPLFLVAISVTIGIVVIKNDIWAMGISIISVVLWYIILAITEKYRKGMKKFIPVIVAVETVPKEEENGDEEEKLKDDTRNNE